MKLQISIEEFGALVRQRREALGWTQEALAADALRNADRKGYISQIENGKLPNISAITVQKIAAALKIDRAQIDQMFGFAAPDADEVRGEIEALTLERGTLQEALDDLRQLSRAQLIALATQFELERAFEQSDTALRTSLELKAEDYRALQREIAALRGVSARADNICAVAQAAVRVWRLDEASRLLEDARETIKEQLREPLEANAKLMEAQADIALIRGRVEEAYRILSAAADSFASIDLTESARRRLRYANRLYQHGRRYGGRGLALSAEMNRATLGILTEADHGVDWAGTQTNLANALQMQGRQTGGAAGAALLAEAVAAYRAALLVWTEAAHPVDWAMTQNNLAVAHEAQGTWTGGAAGAAMLAEAVAACRASLRVRTEAVHPVEWAGTQNNIAIALQAQGTQAGGAEGAALLAEAVAAYRAALRVWTEADHPVDWAATQNNLAGALAEQGRRTGGAEGATLLDEAVAAYRAALRVWTEADHPVDWAATQNNLAIALRAQGTQSGGAAGAALLAEAVAAYGAALRVWTEADHPVNWATTMENLALAEEARADHATCADPRPHLEAALDHVAAALRVFDPAHMPYNHEKATRLRDSLAQRLAALR